MVREIAVKEWRVQATNENYSFLHRTKSLSNEVNGKADVHPASKLFEGLEQADIISPKGRLLRTELNKDLVREWKRIFPASTHEEAEKTLTAEAFAEMDRDIWEQLVAALAGRSIRQGDTWTVKIINDRSQTSRLSKERHILYSFPAVARHGEGDTTVKVLYFMSTDEKMFKESRLGDAKDIYSPEVGSFLRLIVSGRPVVNLCIKRLVRAETMTVISEDTIRQTITHGGRWFAGTNRNQSKTI